MWPAPIMGTDDHGDYWRSELWIVKILTITVNEWFVFSCVVEFKLLSVLSSSSWWTISWICCSISFSISILSNDEIFFISIWLMASENEVTSGHFRSFPVILLPWKLGILTLLSSGWSAFTGFLKLLKPPFGIFGMDGIFSPLKRPLWTSLFFT